MNTGVVDAFEEIISGVGEGNLGTACRVRTVSGNHSRLGNGIEYCFVEITCSDGIQYGIEGFGEEALELRRRASATSSFNPPAYALTVRMA